MMLYVISRYQICANEGQVFDIGCGKGAFTSRLKKLPRGHIRAVDIAPTAIRKAKKMYGTLGINFRVIDIQKEYKTLKKRFDLIIISQLMWYILPTFKAIMEWLSMNNLKQGGYLLISQAFYKPGEQTYGKETVSTPEDILRLIPLKPIELIETNRFTNHDVIVLCKKG